jgi:Rrf2 family protein
MRFSLQEQYAVCGVFDLAYNGRDEPVRIGLISERQAIPTRYLEQIFQRLRRAEIVVSKRGPGGGYSLARPPAEITVRDVIEAVEGPLADALEMAAPEAGDGSLRPGFLWGRLAERFADALASLTIDDLCQEAARADVRRAEPEPPMYFI